MVALFAALTAVGAWIQIPLVPVPFTFQVFFVLLAGLLLGPWLGALSQLVYVLLGVTGLPVFAGGTSGPGILFGPTGGYLFGFIFGAYIAGRLVDAKVPKLLSTLIPAVSGIIVIYVLGMVQLAVVADLSLAQAFLAGVVPFVGFDLIKAVIAATVAQRLSILGITAAATSQ
jgi:biotin transport system substrate-specific component